MADGIILAVTVQDLGLLLATMEAQDHEAEADRLRALMRRASSTGDLRPQQHEFARRIAQCLRRGDNVAIQAPTGIGKTIIGCGCAQYIRTDGPVCYVVHTKRLQSQVYEDAARACGAGSVAILYGKSNYVCAGRRNKLEDEVFPKYWDKQGTKPYGTWLGLTDIRKLLDKAFAEKIRDPRSMFCKGYVRVAREAREAREARATAPTDAQMEAQATYIFDLVCCKKDCCEERAPGMGCSVRDAKNRFVHSTVGITNYHAILSYYLFGYLRTILPGERRLVFDEADQQREVMESQLDQKLGFTMTGKFPKTTLTKASRLGYIPPSIDDAFAEIPDGLPFDSLGRARPEAAIALERLHDVDADFPYADVRAEAPLFASGGQYVLPLRDFCITRGWLTLDGLDAIVECACLEKLPHMNIVPCLQRLFRVGLPPVRIPVSFDIYDEVRLARRYCGDIPIQTEAIGKTVEHIVVKLLRGCGSLVYVKDGSANTRVEDVRETTTTWERYKQHARNTGSLDTEIKHIQESVAAVLKIERQLTLARAALSGYDAWRACDLVERDEEGVEFLYPALENDVDEEGTVKRVLRVRPTAYAVTHYQTALYDSVKQVVFMSATLIVRPELLPRDAIEPFRRELGGEIELQSVRIPSSWDYGGVRLTYGSSVGPKVKKIGWSDGATMAKDGRRRNVAELDDNVRRIAGAVSRMVREGRAPVVFVIGPHKNRLKDVKERVERALSHLPPVRHIWYWDDKDLEDVPDSGGVAAEPTVVYGSNSLAIGIDKEVDAVVLLQVLKDVWPSVAIEYSQLQKRSSGVSYEADIRAVYENMQMRRTIQGCGRLVRRPPDGRQQRKELMVLDEARELGKRIALTFPGIERHAVQIRPKRDRDD